MDDFYGMQDTYRYTQHNPAVAAIGEGSVIYWPAHLVRREHIRIGAHCCIDAFCKVEGGQGLTIGDYVHIGAFSSVNVGGGTLIIEDYVGTSAGVRLVSGTSLYSIVMPGAVDGADRRTTRLCRWAMLGANSVVLQGVTVGEGAVIGAGAVVRADVPAWEIWAGVPARKIGERSPAGAHGYMAPAGQGWEHGVNAPL